MDYDKMFRVENEAVEERYSLSVERIGLIIEEETVEEPFRAYFKHVAEFMQMISNKSLNIVSLEELQKLNAQLYGDIMPGHYEESYANPAYSVALLGQEYGQLLSYLYAEIRGQIIFAYEHRLTDITILNELFIEIYNLFEGEIPEVQSIRDAIYYSVFDYCDYTEEYRARECVDPSLSFARRIVLESDLEDLRYLYSYGEYISKSELEVASFLNSLPQETIDIMADTYTEGYRKGFEVMRRDLSKKKTVVIRYELGFERMIKKAIQNFHDMGLEAILYRSAVWSVNRNPNRKVGYYSSSPNKQYDYDHRYDSAVYLCKAIKDRRLAVIKVAYEKYKKEASLYAGPAVLETFGEEGFSPVNNIEALKLSEKQEQVMLLMSNESSQLIQQYIPGDETSFTIIAFPIPAIGAEFGRIFEETIRINTLDYEKYKYIQQALIDVLDKASYVEIQGKGPNKTKLRVSLHPIHNPEQETNFENCLADVNIPLGEVFTSPILAGTDGTLFVSSVYVGDIQFKDLFIEFSHGMIANYGCSNFDDEASSKALVKQTILRNHETLPMGEFAIGTNTVAYAMAQSFGIVDKLPILIVEKMGPHFAVGDTCYSWAEDSQYFNFNGKEIIAKDNEVSALRKEDPSKAYFSCHTDITIPYDELDTITAVTALGERLFVIENGKFAVPGTEELNKPLT